MLSKPYRNNPVPLILCTCLMLLAHSLKAQISVAFTPDKTAGCPPLFVSFTNNTTGASALATYTWNFGNGNTISTSDAVTPVSAVYTIGQPDTITLTVNDRGKTFSQSEIINVYKGPTVAFTVNDSIGCLPLTSVFASTATPGNGTISNYFWDFGDGNTLSTTSPTAGNTYNFSGTHSVTLTVTNSQGCTGSLVKPALITILPSVTAAFKADLTTLCSLNQGVLFHNNTTGPGRLSYIWDFGDGSGTGTDNPSHVYAKKGIYTVELTAVSSAGCSSKLVKNAYIDVVDFHADFTEMNSVCVGIPALFTDSSSPAPSGTPTWNFGDGLTGKGKNISHTFAAAGNYPVTLTDYFGHCVDSAVHTIYILPAPPAHPFLVQQQQACTTPIQVQFTDTTASAVSWAWNFTGRPGDTSSLQDPIFSYKAVGVYHPVLKVINANGCTTMDTLTTAVQIPGTSAGIRIDTSLQASPTICAIVTARLSAVSQDTLTQFNWSFGDGTTSTSDTPSHTYSTPGTYYISLNYVTNHGCSGTVTGLDSIMVYPKPIANFSALDTAPCSENTKERFVNQSNKAAQYYWIWGDGSAGINNQPVVYHQYDYSGNYTFTLIASSPGCVSDTAVKTQYLISGPNNYLQAANSCLENRDTVTFTDTTSNADKYIWNFGDGTPADSSILFVPQRVHKYSTPGKYAASLTIVYGACRYPEIDSVYVLPPQRPLLSSTGLALCGSGQLPIQITGLDTNYAAVGNNLGGYYHIAGWQYSDFTTSVPGPDSSMKVQYTDSLTRLKPGEDSLRVILRSAFFGCYDTSNYIPVKISGPVAVFNVQSHICYSSPVIFTDSSKGTGGVPIVQWIWNFGDSATLIRFPADTVGKADTAIHLYAFPGNYIPTLTVIDANGCSSTTTSSDTTLTVVGPKADFYWNPVDIAPGSPVTFYNSSFQAVGATFQWHFSSDGFNSTAPDSLSRTYPNITSDTVSLVASIGGSGGCKDTLVQVVKILNLLVSFSSTTEYINSQNCPPMVAYFTSKTSNADSLHWDFGDSSTAENNPSPSHTYNTPGIYVVSLTGYSTNGLSIVYKDTLLVKGPYAVFQSSLYQGCIPVEDTLHAGANFVSTFIWDFGDGSVLTTKDTLATHTYIIPGIYTPILVLSDSTGCQTTYRLPLKLVMDTLHASIGPDTLLCGPGSVAFKSRIFSPLVDTLNEVLTYHWNFGTGNAGDTANTGSPGFTYANPGNFQTRFQVSSPAGCQVTLSDSVRIIPPIALKYPQEAYACQGKSIPLTVQGADFYDWIGDSTLTDINGGSAVSKPDSVSHYTIIATDSSHCFTDTAHITVANEPYPTVNLPSSLVAVAGKPIPLEPTVSSNVSTYDWSPADYLSCTNCASPVSLPVSPITYMLTVATQYGCTASDTISIKLLCSEGAVHVPSEFTPNNDGINDWFYPIVKGIKLIRHFQVYDRWGMIVFDRENLPINDGNSGWDGTKNGKICPVGGYVYMMEFMCETGEIFSLKGTVILAR